MAKPIAGSWGWHAEYGLCFIIATTRDNNNAPVTYTVQDAEGNQLGLGSAFRARHDVPASEVTILLHRDDLIALANRVRQAKGT